MYPVVEGVTELLPKNGFRLKEFFEIAIPLMDASSLWPRPCVQVHYGT